MLIAERPNRGMVPAFKTSVCWIKWGGVGFEEKTYDSSALTWYYWRLRLGFVEVSKWVRAI